MGRLGKKFDIREDEGYHRYFSTLDKVWQQLEDAGACGVEGTHLLTGEGYSEYADSVALVGEVLGKVRSTRLGLETGILARFKSYKDVLEDRLRIEYQAHQQAVEKEVFETLEKVTGKSIPIPPSKERFIDPEGADEDESVDEVENSIFDEGVVPEEEIKGIKEIEGIEEIEALRPESAKDVLKGIQGYSEADYSDEETEEDEEGFDYDDDDEPEEELDYGDDDEPTPEGGIKKSSKADVLNVQKGRKLNEPLIKDKRHIRGIPGHEMEDAFFDGAEKLLGRLGL